MKAGKRRWLRVIWMVFLLLLFAFGLALIVMGARENSHIPPQNPVKAILRLPPFSLCT